LLVDANANVNYQNLRGRSALHSAAQEGHYEILLILISAGAILSQIDEDGRGLLRTIF